MQLSIRNKWITVRGSSVVKDLNEQDVMKVRGKFFSFTQKKFVTTLNDEVKYIVRNKFWRLFVYRAFVLDPEGNKVAVLRKKFWSVHDHFTVNCSLGEITIRGNILGFNYDITLNGEKIGHVSRKLSVRDSFVLDIKDDADPYFYVALVIAIDNITDRRRNDSDSSFSSSSGE